ALAIRRHAEKLRVELLRALDVADMQDDVVDSVRLDHVRSSLDVVLSLRAIRTRDLSEPASYVKEFIRGNQVARQGVFSQVYRPEAAMSLLGMTTAVILIASSGTTSLGPSPASTDAARIATNGGFLLGHAHRCCVTTDCVFNTG